MIRAISALALGSTTSAARAATARRWLMSDPVDLNELEAAEKLVGWLHRAGWNESAATVNAVVARLRQAEAERDVLVVQQAAAHERHAAEVVSLREALAAEQHKAQARYEEAMDMTEQRDAARAALLAAEGRAR